jgi:hypothetical protein
VAASEELATSSEELAYQAGHLREMINYFKINQEQITPENNKSKKLNSIKKSDQNQVTGMETKKTQKKKPGVLYKLD